MFANKTNHFVPRSAALNVSKMSEQNRTVFTGATIAAAAAGIGVCLVVTKYRTHILKRLKRILNYNDPLRNQQIQVINNVEECRAVMRNLKT